MVLPPIHLIVKMVILATIRNKWFIHNFLILRSYQTFENPHIAPLKIVAGQKCLKNQPCDVIKLWEMKGEVGKKPPPPKKKRWKIPYFYDVTWLIFETLCLATSK